MARLPPLPYFSQSSSSQSHYTTLSDRVKKRVKSIYLLRSEEQSDCFLSNTVCFLSNRKTIHFHLCEAKHLLTPIIRNYVQRAFWLCLHNNVSVMFSVAVLKQFHLQMAMFWNWSLCRKQQNCCSKHARPVDGAVILWWVEPFSSLHGNWQQH